ncbi:MAG: outer membrane protein assembly factor BamA [Phycisphaerae bacterium]|nr:outer membrane protein assembly factor BamA [Phycisphaerae bacterium]
MAAAGIVALAGAILVTFALAQDAGSPVGKKIVKINVAGNKATAAQEILGQTQVREGQVYTRDTIQEDVRNIVAMGRFDSVTPETEVTPQGVVLTFRVVERPKIESVDFIGARSVKQKDVAAEANLDAGNYMDAGKVAAARQRVLDLYQSKGYHYADVTVDAEALKKNRVVFEIREGPRVRVQKIFFRGNDSLSAGELKKEIETKAYMWIFSPGNLDEKVVKEDVTRIKQHYRDEGYLDVDAGYTVEPLGREDRVAAVFLVKEGPRYRIDSIKFEGNNVFQAHQLRGQMLLQPGQYYTAAAQKHDLKAIRDQLYGAEGYYNTGVEISPRFTDEKGVVNLVVRVNESKQIFVGRINIVGNELTHDKVVRRKIRLYPEQPYNVVEADKSRDDLMATQLFSKVEIAPAAAGQGNERDVLVLVDEARTTSVMFGIGISSDAGLLGNVTLENRNFDLFGWPKTARQLFSSRAFKGAGQTLRIVAEPGTSLNRFQVQFYEPFLMDRPVSLGTNLFFFTRPRESYTESRLGYIVSFGQKFRKNWQLEEALRIEGVDISGVDHNAPKDVRDAEGSHLLIGGKFTVARDTTDNQFMPSTGNRVAFSVEPVGGTDTFVKFTGDMRAYRTLRTDIYDRKTVLDGRVNVGYIPGDAPIFERFYAGGINSMRGFKYRGVGPHDGPDHDPIGGDFQFLASGEYVFPLWGKSQGVFFLDTGTVEPTPSISSYRVSVGFEVRIPIKFFGSVPLTIGLGVPVAKDKDDETQILHFLFGTSF